MGTFFFDMTTSFRDPAGHLLMSKGRVFRFVKGIAADDLRAFLSSTTARKFTDSCQLVRTDFLDAESIQELGLSEKRNQTEDSHSDTVVEHERIPFPSFPYEWPPEMLHAAGSLTLDLAQDLLAEGFGIKDATPYNVLFSGPNPVFIDLLSFERRDPTDPTWIAYGQFVRTFLLPLLVNKRYGLRLDDMLITHRDGLEPEEVYRFSSFWQKMQPESLTLVSIPNWLAARKGSDETKIYQKRSVNNPEKAKYILGRLLKVLRRKLDRTAPVTRKSRWSDYMSNNRYTEDYFPEKEAFVHSVMAEWRVQRVLDVGCNTGHFSKLVAKHGAAVVAIDYDPVVAGEVWRAARTENLDILPLVVDLTRPTPAIGWRNEECPSFLERARGSFDAVLMLAVIHHMLVSERIPLSQVLRVAAELTTNLLIVEFVAPGDPMFRLLTRGREHLHQDLTVEVFEATAGCFFQIMRATRLGESERWIYLLRKKEAAQRA